MTPQPYFQSLDHCPVAHAEPCTDALASACAALSADVAAGRLACLTIAHEQGDLADLAERADAIAAGADDVLLLGVGGSSLGARSLLALATAPRVRCHLIDNVDPQTWKATLDSLDPRRTHILAVSKSGSTVETVAQTVLAARWLDAAGVPFGVDNFTVITEPGSRPLRDHAERLGAVIFDHAADIGGRYAVLSSVGMLPALLGGLDAAALRQGAASVLDNALAQGAKADPARGAALAVALERSRAMTTHAMLVYADRLVSLGHWYAQLWAESLGKGGMGTNPLVARGVTDQHSQLQLWIDGPRDKWLTVIGHPSAGTGPAFGEIAGLDYLAGRTLGDLFEAEREATVESLAAAGVPVRTIMVEHINERALGALFMHFMLETILAGHLMGVDPFGQPAVEDGKRRARAALASRAL